MTVDELKAVMLEEFREVKERQDVANGRVRDIELWKARVTGFLMAVGVLASLPSIVLTIALIVEKR